MNFSKPTCRILLIKLSGAMIIPMGNFLTWKMKCPFWNLCMKMNVPQKEAAQYVRKVRERKMGYWFENMEKMDIQKERKNTARARKAAEQAKKELEQAKKEAAENSIKSVIEVCQGLGASTEQTIMQLMTHCHLDRQTAVLKTNGYSQNRKREEERDSL